jgi:RodZ C-terminal domain
MRDPLDDQLDETFRALQAHNAAARESSSRRRIGDGRLGRRVLLVTLALITLGAGAVFGALVSGAIDLSSGGTKTPAAARKPSPATPAQRKPPITAKPASVTPATTTAPAATPPATTAATTTTAKKQTTKKKKKATTASANHTAMPPLLHLQLRAARGDSWAMVRVGDSTGPVVYSGIVRKGTSATVDARGKLWARFGAVANLDLVLNGKAVRPSHTGTINTFITAAGLSSAPAGSAGAAVSQAPAPASTPAAPSSTPATSTPTTTASQPTTTAPATTTPTTTHPNIQVIIVGQQPKPKPKPKTTTDSEPKVIIGN